MVTQKYIEFPSHTRYSDGIILFSFARNAKGISKPRQAQKQKIENALHRLGSELMSLSF